ncbi:hypothetical protein HYG81_20895 (plasmid) [Natrinema zhouii]|uniref:HalOD1 output domain-containing protein n=1 Tax=Natrinema zhouii TaxID=1710539 RepID=UPI001CFFC45A|nr:HalOD1 output domain-containing protein [Natrinema zhouii]UHQ98070.1 hypothetical protein HYG81_20895 [Natrinema zhouii]
MRTPVRHRAVGVLEAISDAEDASPTILEPPLNDVVDPATLDRLFEPTATDDSA